MIATSTTLHKDPLFVGATRPPMRWGVTYAALLGTSSSRWKLSC